jgi:hypothetical protein
MPGGLAVATQQANRAHDGRVVDGGVARPQG